MDNVQILEAIKTNPELYAEIKKLIESENSTEQLKKDLAAAQESIKQKDNSLAELSKANGDLSAKLQVLENEKAENDKKILEQEKKNLIVETLKSFTIDAEKVSVVLKESWLTLDKEKISEVVKAFGESFKTAPVGNINLRSTQPKAEAEPSAKKYLEMESNEFYKELKKK